VISSVRRALSLLTELRVPVIGVLENMARARDRAVQDLSETHGVPFLGSVPFDPGLEDALGDVGELRRGRVFGALDALTERLGI
jgi:hypothetical protein